ncbi:MAG: ArsR family transcriptional regulator [Rhodobacteraceae bacterium]|nr:MAG: ArsR family transcriptional regulator [Paracoccaceae bacterium]
MTHGIDSSASALAALGHPARLSLFRLLVRAEPQGLRVSEIGTLLDIPLSTLAHHLRSLKQAGLIRQQRDGREVQTRADVQALRDVLEFVVCECCEGVATPTPIQEVAP